MCEGDSQAEVVEVMSTERFQSLPSVKADVAEPIVRSTGGLIYLDADNTESDVVRQRVQINHVGVAEDEIRQNDVLSHQRHGHVRTASSYRTVEGVIDDDTEAACCSVRQVRSTVGPAARTYVVLRSSDPRNTGLLTHFCLMRQRCQ